MKFDIITIFPQFFDSFKKEALIARAIKKKIIKISAHNLRKWTSDNHQTVDDRPYGGGAGMVMRADVVAKAVKSFKGKGRVILFSASGKKFNQATARRWSKYRQLIFICGRYEGIDERVARHIADEEISIGDYVLFGGEIPAMVIIEAVSRLIPGTIAKEMSVEEESFKEIKGIAKKQLKQFIEYPHYTRPETVKIKGRGRKVPKVLLSGDHKRIDSWRNRNSKIKYESSR